MESDKEEDGQRERVLGYPTTHYYPATSVLVDDAREMGIDVTAAAVELCQKGLQQYYLQLHELQVNEPKPVDPLEQELAEVVTRWSGRANGLATFGGGIFGAGLLTSQGGTAEELLAFVERKGGDARAGGRAGGPVALLKEQLARKATEPPGEKTAGSRNRAA